MSDLQYRPNHYDDWGMIRNADGSMHASVHRPEIYLGEFDEHREADTDPFADLARKIIFFDDLEAENANLRQLLSEAENRERETLTQLSELAKKEAEELMDKWISDRGATVDTKAAGVASHIVNDFRGHIEAALIKADRRALQSEER